VIYIGSVLVGLGLVAASLLAFVLALLYPSLPELTAITEYQPKVPLRVYTAEGELIGEFGVERRTVVKLQQVPLQMREAILAAEDERFYEHSGVDYVGVVRAVYSNLFREVKPGASTITMQLAREFFLTRERTITRKLREVLLALKIEKNLSKDQILEIYINQINLGQRAYGFAAAAQTYFGRPLEQLELPEIAMLAGLPKAPSRFNPVVNPKRAKIRQLYVLRRMHELGYIDDEQWKRAQDAPVRVARENGREGSLHAEYVAEMARQIVFDAYGEEAYSKGLSVYTTIRRSHQEAAYAAMRRGVTEYERRHGYRGPEGFAALPADPAQVEDAIEAALQDYPDADNLFAAVVLEASPAVVRAVKSDGETVELQGEGLRFAARALAENAASSTRVRRGSVIRLMKDERGKWQITQAPQVEAAFVSIQPSDGAVEALVGGFDYGRSKYNHATQAFRQPGSAFKPFVYSAALEKGFTPATIVNDAPMFFDASQLGGGEAWEPKNYDGTYEGPMRLRTALAKSKNMVSIRILQAIGPQYVQDYIRRFGFDPKLHPAYLTLALGAGSATPLQMATAYSVFANGGYRVDAYVIDRIVDAKGVVLSRAEPVTATAGAERVIDARNAWLMTSLLQEVVRSGTATRAQRLGRKDLAGKTGTTNDNVDAWFCGFTPDLVGVAWIGFDQPKTLGNNETGSLAALPIWIDYMAKALRGARERVLEPPPGVVAVRINPETGLREPDDRGGVIEQFYQEYVPRLREDSLAGSSSRSVDEIKNQLY
jgi:penicillin-binding protein 1A